MYDIVVFELKGFIELSDKVFLVCLLREELSFGIECYIIGDINLFNYIFLVKKVYLIYVIY